jgi:hypothetical protein
VRQTAGYLPQASVAFIDEARTCGRRQLALDAASGRALLQLR